MSTKPSQRQAPASRARKPAAAHAVDASDKRPPSVVCASTRASTASEASDERRPVSRPLVVGTTDVEPEPAASEATSASEHGFALNALEIAAAATLTEFHADFAEMVKKLPHSALKDVKSKLAKLGVDPASASPACAQALSDAVGRYERKRTKAREASAAKRAAKVSPVAE